MHHVNGRLQKVNVISNANKPNNYLRSNYLKGTNISTLGLLVVVLRMSVSVATWPLLKSPTEVPEPKIV